MDTTSAIKALIKDNGKSQVWLAEKMGYTHQSAIHNILMRGNLTVDTLYDICELFEYEVTIQPKRRAGARPAGQIVLTGSTKEQREARISKGKTRRTRARASSDGTDTAE